MKTFELVVVGRPVSQQARRRERLREWKDHVKRLAVQTWTVEHSRPLDDATLTLIHLYREAALDIDNIVKPIQDALIGVALEDDSQVSDLVVRRRRLATAFPLDRLTPTLAAAVDSGEEFIYVRVEDAPAAEALE
jgi:crossover junction endodeoxyribonuclease RusA